MDERVTFKTWSYIIKKVDVQAGHTKYKTWSCQLKSIITHTPKGCHRSFEIWSHMFQNVTVQSPKKSQKTWLYHLHVVLKTLKRCHTISTFVQDRKNVNTSCKT